MGVLVEKSSSSFGCTKGCKEGGACSTSTKSKASSSSAVGTMFEHAFWMYHNTENNLNVKTRHNVSQHRK